MLIDKTVGDLLDAFAAPVPAPAGGSASALASAVGASLLLMVARLPGTRAETNEDRRLLTAAVQSLSDLQRQLAGAVDADADAYARVISARGEAKQEALLAAIEVPLQVMRWSAGALGHAKVIAAHCHRSTSSDVRVGVGLLRAGFEGARSSAIDNLRRISNRTYVDATGKDIERLSAEAGSARDTTI